MQFRDFYLSPFAVMRGFQQAFMDLSIGKEYFVRPERPGSYQPNCSYHNVGGLCLSNRDLKSITALLVLIAAGTAHGQAPPVDGRTGALQLSDLGGIPSNKVPLYSISATPNPVAP